MSQDGCCPTPAKQQKQLSSPVPINCLSDDLLLEIFLRLPSLATLIRAAFTCRAWRRAVASSPSFRRRFRKLHRAPLLGVFADPTLISLPVFAPAHSRDADVLAAIGRGNFALTPLSNPYDEVVKDVPLRWRLMDCRHGYLLLFNIETRLLATVNPLARHLPDYIDLPSPADETSEAPPGKLSLVDVRLLSSEEEDTTSFRVVCLINNESRVQVAVFSSDSLDWCFHPWVKVAERPQAQPRDDTTVQRWLSFGHQANEFMYWLFTNREHVLTLDTATMNFSVLKIPPHFNDQQQQQGYNYNFVVSGTKDGTPCIVYCVGMNVGKMIHRVDQHGVETWILAGTVKYEEVADDPSENNNNEALNIMAVTDDFVYLATSKMVLSLCLETMELDKLFPRSFCTDRLYPYAMAWPPSVSGNCYSFSGI